ncbi:MAG: hypothetical protein ACJAS4_000271 [Bacteriovoracaceae bacterium]|jgi:hypothetical protein
MFKLKILVVMSLIISSCSSTKDNSKRDVAGGNMGDASTGVSEADYKKDRGQKAPIKFSYDGYEAQKLKFLRTVVNPLHPIESKRNLDFLNTGTSLRQNLFENNLTDTGVDEAFNVDCSKVMKMKRRTPTGNCYFHGLEDTLSEQDKDLATQVMMGAHGQRFGRNTQPHAANKASRKDIMEPNPFMVSQRLFNRTDGKTKKAEVVNLLAAAWLQSMNHDWFTHGKNSKKHHHQVPGHSGHKHKHFQSGHVSVPKTRAETEKEAKTDKNGYNYASRNQVTHWWDGSQFYGSDAATIKKVRTKYNADGTSTGQLMPNGKIAVDEKNRRLIYDTNKLPITGFNDNWWLGLELIHTLFHLEHNRIVETILLPQVKSGNICKDTKGVECDNEIFEKARLINSALIAKIHTVEWTPALLNHPMLHIAMRGNWYGLRELWGGNSENLRGKISMDKKHIISGLVGPKTLDLYKVPFTLTEEFVSVYRMHPLIPEAIDFRSHKNPTKVTKNVPLQDVIFRKAVGQIKGQGSTKGSSADWMFSFGTSHPGGLVLNNYPTFMQNFVAERNTGTAHTDSVRMDMGAIDILRDRERGVPRYNNFRRALGLPAAKDFDDLAMNAKDAANLSDVYGGDIEKVDLLVGSLAEKDRYPGYAFGNTPFWIFAIMASRRLMADPFFSDYYTDEVYTRDGIQYIQKRTMADVLVSHYPELKSKFYETIHRRRPGNLRGWKKNPNGKGYIKEVLRVKNAFRPWRPVYEKVEAKL